MGIVDLLPQVQPLARRVHVDSYRNKAVAVDSYCWLHRAVFHSAAELALGIPTDAWKRLFEKKVQMLISCGVTPIMVWDGSRLPAKANTEQSRLSRRESELLKGLQHLEEGDKKNALKHFRGSVDVTPAMAAECIRLLRAQGVECIVAPYEADAQLAALALTDRVHAVISEDSDLLAFGCPRVLFKLDHQGYGDEVGYAMRRRRW